MKLIIHRGTHQIGGCVTELRTSTTRIVIDMGSPLPGLEETAPEQKLFLPGATAPGKICDGVFLTHTHGDHMGQIGGILPEVPLFLGEAAREVALTLYRRLARRNPEGCIPILAALERARTFHPGVPLTVGNLHITPLLVDHSAFDAYMFLIEGDGIRILHTGDFRSHGPRGKALYPTLRRYVGQVDWLICEGTMLSRSPAPVMTEWELGRRAHTIIQKHSHVFVLCSSTNVDRIAVFSRNTPCRRPVICDEYQREILNRVELHSGGKSSFYRFDRVIPYSSRNAKLLHWMEDQGFLLFVRANDRFRQFMESYRKDCVVLYSMWNGYLEGPCANPGLIRFLNGFPVIRLHTSGHAGRETLREVCRILQPRRGLIPIHGEQPEVFYSLAPACRVVPLRDGESLTL